MLVCPDARNAQNNMATVAEDSSTVWGPDSTLGRLFVRPSMALVVRALETGA
jgi:hypothetical protein